MKTKSSDARNRHASAIVGRRPDSVGLGQPPRTVAVQSGALCLETARHGRHFPPDGRGAADRGRGRPWFPRGPTCRTARYHRPNETGPAGGKRFPEAFAALPEHLRTLARSPRGLRRSGEHRRNWPRWRGSVCRGPPAEIPLPSSSCIDPVVITDQDRPVAIPQGRQQLRGWPEVVIQPDHLNPIPVLREQEPAQETARSAGAGSTGPGPACFAEAARPAPDQVPRNAAGSRSGKS